MRRFFPLARSSRALLFALAQRTCDGAASGCGARTGNHLPQRRTHPTDPRHSLRRHRLGFTASFGARSDARLGPSALRGDRPSLAHLPADEKGTRESERRRGAYLGCDSAHQSQGFFVHIRYAAQRSSKLEYGRGRSSRRTTKRARWLCGFLSPSKTAATL
jgi:hypothetical protein